MSTELILAAGICVCLTAYVLGAGADFGAGVWDLFASGARKDAQRSLIEDAMGPVWEANHVWLIFSTVLLFSGFPRAFADIATTLHVPLTLFLFGVVLRGSMFTFRHYDTKAHARIHTAVFAAASVLAPFWLGVCAAMLSAPQPDPTSAPWLTTFTVMSGVLVTALFALLAAVYLAWEAKEGPLARDFQKRALISLASVVILLAVDVALARTAAPAMLAGIRDKPISVGAIVLGGVSVLGLVMSLHASAFRAARLCVVGFGSAFVIGWGSQRHPYLIEPAWTLTSAASMPATQKMLIVTSIGGACFLVPSLVFLFRVFKAKPAAENEASHD